MYRNERKDPIFIYFFQIAEVFETSDVTIFSDVSRVLDQPFQSHINVDLVFR